MRGLCANTLDYLLNLCDECLCVEEVVWICFPQSVDRTRGYKDRFNRLPGGRTSFDICIRGICGVVPIAVER